MTSLEQIVKAYDIRGTVPDQLDPEIAAPSGSPSPSSTGAPRVLVGRDMRPSGVELVAAFAEGMMVQGVDVVDVGLVSTDLVYFAAGRFDAPGAMFTASHNPAQYNGVKLCLAGARPVGADTGLADIGGGGGGARRPPSRAGVDAGHLTDARPAGRVRRPCRVVHRPDRRRPAAGRGRHRQRDGRPGRAQGVRAPPPVELEVMYGELDGTFPNHPADPIQPANQLDLQARVVAGGFDLGLAFDGDADRVFVVDEAGRGLSGSTTTAMLAAGMLDKHPGGTILHNLICSRAVPEVVREHGGIPIRTKVGHSYIKQIMAESGAVFGGEHSAHYYFRDNYRADSGTSARIASGWWR